MSNSNALPALISAPRIITLVSSLFVTLSSGTNYVYSAYAPQLGARLNITHTQLNIIALAGNVGVYSSGPFWGRIVDHKGPRILLASAFVLLLSGYSGIRHFFDQGVAEGSTLSTLSFSLLVLCGFLTGAGGNGGLTSAVNSTAKTFPDRLRASVTGVVISGFGLSAFLFSTISHVAFAGNTSSFLLLLALGTAFPMIVGFFFIRPIPLPAHEHLINGARPEDEERLTVQSPYDGDNDSHTRLLDQVDSEERFGGGRNAVNSRDEVELSPPRSNSRSVHRGRSVSLGSARSLGRGAAVLHDDLPNIYGRKLWRNPDFYILFTILSILSGTGLMYINNVGSMSQALYAYGTTTYNEIEASKWQAQQVSYISIMNFAGRIFIGLVCDFVKGRLGLPRSYCLVLVSFFFFFSQVTAARVNDVHDLWIASLSLGLAHGSVFSLLPLICIEWFGLPHFSENWGYLSMSPMAAGNLFSLVFGRNLDAHERVTSPQPANLTMPGVNTASAAVTTITTTTHVRSLAAPLCLEGRECYVASLYLTIGACLFAMGLSVWAGWRDRKKLMMMGGGGGGIGGRDRLKSEERGGYEEVSTVVVWDGREGREGDEEED